MKYKKRILNFLIIFITFIFYINILLPQVSANSIDTTKSINFEQILVNFYNTLSTKQKISLFLGIIICISPILLIIFRISTYISLLNLKKEDLDDSTKELKEHEIKLKFSNAILVYIISFIIIFALKKILDY